MAGGSGHWWRVAAVGVSAQWAAVSVFEGVIDLPDRLAHSTSTGVFGRGSPARFHVPFGAILLGTTVGCLVTNWRNPDGRPLLVAGFGATILAAAVTGVAIGTVNVPLLEGTAPEDERERLVRRWHRLNVLRVTLVVAGGSLTALSGGSAHRIGRA